MLHAARSRLACACLPPETDVASAAAAARRDELSRMKMSASKLGRTLDASWRSKARKRGCTSPPALTPGPQIAVTKRKQQQAKLELAAEVASVPQLAPPVRVRERRAQAKALREEGRAAVQHTRQKAALLAPAPPAKLSPEEAEAVQIPKILLPVMAVLELLLFVT